MPPIEKATRIRQRGTTEYRDEANALLEQPGDAVVVERGIPRSFVIKCPDGCGETLAINLDRRTGKAWRLETEKNSTVSLHPSIWKAGGCRSHFVVRQSRIIWCEPKIALPTRADGFTPDRWAELDKREAGGPESGGNAKKPGRPWIARAMLMMLTRLKNLFRN